MMRGSNLDLQGERVKSVSAQIEDHEVKIQPTRTCQMLYKVIPAGKVILTLLAAVVLVALLVAVILNQKQISELKEKLSNLEQAQQTKPADIEPSQPPSTGVLASTSPVTPVQTPTLTSEEQTKPADIGPSQPPSTRVASTSPITPTQISTLPTTISPSDTSLTSCATIHSSHPSAPSGVYTIHIGGRVKGREVWCDMEANGGGWTRFQRRRDGSVSFNRTWSEYKQGFGTADNEIWLGNDDIHTLTSAQPSELRVDLWDWEAYYGSAKYSNFNVANASTNYTLHVGGYSYTGTIVDSLKWHNSQQFTTRDHDNDGYSGGNCATSVGGGGGWWYHSCGSSNLNGRYLPGAVNGDQHGVEWDQKPGHYTYYSFRATSMMVRPST